MTSAWRLSQRHILRIETEKDLLFRRVLGTKPIDGAPERLKSALQDNERQIEETILPDHRLARSAQWKRAEEEETCDAGLLAMGWESHDIQQWEQESAASSPTQRLSEPQTSTPYVPTAEDRLRWAKESRERENHAAAQALSRFTALENP